MARSITVTTQSLNTGAGNLKAENSKFKKKVEELIQVENTLNSMWDGEANDAFHKAFQKDVIQMNNLYNAIEKYVTSLEQIAKEYDRAEKANLNTASTRTYK